MLRRLTTTSSGAAVVCGLLLALGIAAPARADGGPLTALVDAAAQRLEVAEPVAARKWSTHGDIDDPDRIQRELVALRAQAATAHLEPDFPDYVARVFTDQIAATEAIEYARFADWKLDAAGAPVSAPDLSASRAVIDGLNQDMLSQLTANRNLLRSPQCPAQLADAVGDVTSARRFDALYQRALARATASYCG